MEAPIVFTGIWIQDSATPQKPRENWFSGFDFPGDENGFAFALLLIFGIFFIVLAVIRGIREHRQKQASSTATVELTPERLRFINSEHDAEQHFLRDISSIEVQENADSTLESTAVILLTLQDERRVHYRFTAATIHMQAELHRLIQIWRIHVSKLVHLRSGRVVPAWNSDC